MLVIELINEYSYGEPGPNLVIRGDGDGIDRIQKIIKEMLVIDSFNEIITQSKIRLLGFKSLVVKSTLNGNVILGVKNEDEVMIDLPPRLWNKFIELVSTLKKVGDFQYLELDDCDNFTEDANIIVHLVKKV